MTFKRATAMAITAVAVAALTAIGPVAVSPALAHSQLLINSPAVSSTLTKQPKQVSLVFDDDIIDLAGGNQIVVTNSAQKRVDIGATKLEGATISVALKTGLVTGKYQVQYKAISADGHPVTGNYFFYLKIAKKK